MYRSYRSLGRKCDKKFSVKTAVIPSISCFFQRSPLFERVAVGEGGLARHRLQLQVREEVVLREQRHVRRHLVPGLVLHAASGVRCEPQKVKWRCGPKKEQLRMDEGRNKGEAGSLELVQDGLTLGVEVSVTTPSSSKMTSNYFGLQICILFRLHISSSCPAPQQPLYFLSISSCLALAAPGVGRTTNRGIS